MMEKKRSMGVTILGVVGIVIGSVWLIWDSVSILVGPKGSLDNLFLISAHPVIAIGFIISAVAMLQLKHLAPKLFLSTVAAFTLLFSHYLAVVSMTGPHIASLFMYLAVYWLIFGFAPLLFLFIFFTRPKVREQFR